MTVSRRNLLRGSIGVGASLALANNAAAQRFVDANDFGLSPSDGDQTNSLQAAVDAAITLQQPLLIGSGEFATNVVSIGGPLTVRGSGQTVLRLDVADTILAVQDCSHVVLEGLVLAGNPLSRGGRALLEFVSASNFTVRDCRFVSSSGMGVWLQDAEGRIEDCDFSDIADTAVFSTDSRGLDLSGNVITRCGNGGIRIWRSESGADRSRIFGNRISTIDWKDGGNGQNGNGINVFRADGVSITDNHIVDCTFSAIRLNATNDTRVIGNHCEKSGEVAIYSEFGFSGSIISDNVIDGAAAGISMTNFDHNGRLSVCKGNIVRNIASASLTNPDVVPYGIAAEADAAIVGNIVEAVPGTGIVVGWGTYLRDVLVSDNVVRHCDIGISVSVVDGAGPSRISDNLLSGIRLHAIVGTHWRDITVTDLIGDAGSHPKIAIDGNSVH
ncbi:TIGR03808 family TAT-translocated repetitive protein [Devosia sp. MC521]|uniref:TIGR03808 family TAT-translocated repetitive protein n=1 Tax=Devosia sp. MC521 TaxID=2759954 RepID=UPI0015FC712E|nr:TIGR03808 family TAT-translocated repetitive protein [Devosia sp. MC521]MBJ6987440.1 TIGR03808 family TAT-translocated repetitive protein [Devosia sp. MC521]QMW63606.1 TIGR03808 family TAT-translocated repetitive protein [Devosia sp. MC521]